MRQSVGSIYKDNEAVEDNVHQCFSTFLLQRILLQMFALLMEPWAMIHVSILLRPRRAAVANFVPGNFGLFLRHPWQPLAESQGSAEPRLKNTDVHSCWRKYPGQKFRLLSRQKALNTITQI